MKKIFTLFAALLCLQFSSHVFAQSATVYASIASGAWNSGTVWETYSNYAAALAATPGSGTAYTGTSNPGGTHNVLIRPGHTITMGGANRGCKSIIIQAGGKLWANETSARRLQIGSGGTGFTYPLTDTIQVDGALGGSTDGVYIESGVNAQLIKIWGAGAIDIQRIRLIGGAGASDPTTPGELTLTIAADVNLWQAGNYALSAVYNPALTDNYTINVLAGATVAVKANNGYLHNSQATNTYGRYTYRVGGVLDLSANTTSNSANITAPTPANSRVSVTVDGGLFKLGQAFKADTITGSFPSTGLLELRAINSAVVDATITTNLAIGKTTDGAGNVKDLAFSVDATSELRRTVGAANTVFPVGVAGTGTANDVVLNNAGTPDVFTVNVKNSFDAPIPGSDKMVNRQWTINELVAGGSNASVSLSWLTADQAAGFNPADAVFILRYNGSSWEGNPATVSGSGTMEDPYIATASGFTAFSPFAVANAAVLPVAFTNLQAFATGKNVQVNWTNSIESNLARYAVERSIDGSSFSTVGVITEVKNNQAAANYSWLDKSPFSGTNFYRIKAVEKDGKTKYSAIMKAVPGKATGLLVLPNPVKDKVLQFRAELPGGEAYTLRLLNISGQPILSQSIKISGSSQVYSIQLPAGIKPGTYTVQVFNGTNQISEKVIVE